MKKLADRCSSGFIILLFFLPLLFPVLLGGCGSSEDLTLPTEYQAVFLDNGQIFFGKLEKTGPSYITLRDVFYVRTQIDQKKKQARNILVKRGIEWHAPDFMHINTRHVVLIEPVAPESQVAKLIRQSRIATPAALPKEGQQPSTAPPTPRKKKKP